MKFYRGAVLVASLAACSGGADIWDGGVDASKPKADASGDDATILADVASPPDTGTTTDDAGTDAQTSPDLGCLTDDAGCVACCFANHPDGSATYFDTLTGCACKTGATCHSATVCLNNLCKGSDPSAACDKCLSNPDAGDCYAHAETACSNDNDCVAFFDCVVNVCTPPGDAAAD